MMNEFGITDRGFVVKPYEVIFKEEQQAFRGSFGNDIDLADDSIEGVYIRNQSLKIAQLWELLGGLYAIGDVDDAHGIYLDRLVNFVNVERLSSTNTEVRECLWAEEGKVIPKGNLLSLASGELFRLAEAHVVNRSTLLGFTLKVKEVEAFHLYQLQINNSIIAYSSLEDDAEPEIMAGLAAAIEAEFPGEYSLTVGYALEVHSIEGVDSFLMASSDINLQFPLLGYMAVYTAMQTGPIIVTIGALNKIVNKVNGLDHVTNYAPGVTGREKESDTELRMHLGIRQKQATANEIAIQNAIMTVTSVEYAKVYSNRDIVEHDGRPAKSYEAVVVGGDDQAIAEMIFERGPAGVQPFGNVVKDVVDIEGFHWDIGFSRPLNKYIWIKIGWLPNTEEDLPLNVVEAVQNSIMGWSASNMNVGVDLIYQKLFRPIYDILGIGYVEISLAVTDDLMAPGDADYHSENIQIGEVEIAAIDPSRIFVTRMPDPPVPPPEGVGA
jgi:uncharacterized phage protein gp47/JayE